MGIGQSLQRPQRNRGLVGATPVCLGASCSFSRPTALEWALGVAGVVVRASRKEQDSDSEPTPGGPSNALKLGRTPTLFGKLLLSLCFDSHKLFYSLGKCVPSLCPELSPQDW